MGTRKGTGYYPHNYDFMAFAATMAGRRALAVEAEIVLAARIAATRGDDNEATMMFRDATRLELLEAAAIIG